jgi:hypothetical protein
MVSRCRLRRMHQNGHYLADRGTKKPFVLLTFVFFTVFRYFFT